MGYEIRIHVVKEYTSSPENEPREGTEIASIDLCKCDGPVYKLVRKAIKRQEGQRPFALRDNLKGGTVTLDAYNEPLGVISVPDFIAALRSDILSGYRRYLLALAMLESIVQNWQHEVENKSMVVVTYGH